MNNHHPLLQRRSAEAGLTMVELMVALLLGLILIGGAIQVFVSNRAAYAFNEGFSRLQENGRFALDTIGYHTRLAGYLGCRSSGVTVFNNVEDPATVPFDLAQGVFGYEADGTLPGDTFEADATNPDNSDTETDWDPALPADLDGSVIPGSDVLIVRHVNPTSYTLLTPFSSATQVTAVAPANAFGAGDIAVASDCQKSSIFQVTAVGNVGGGIALSHVAAGTPGNELEDWDTDQQYAAGAEVARGETWAFYVGARGDGLPPALFQRRLTVDPMTTTASFDVQEELVEAVETMQVRYGVDDNLDGAIEQYVTADTLGAADWPTVAAVRVAIVTRSPEEYGTEVDDTTYVVDETEFDPVDDRRVRQVFVSTIAIRNRLP